MPHFGAVAPTNGTVSASSATMGNSVTYSCNQGYMVAGTAVSVCQANGTFATTAPTCAPSACPTLVAPANGGVTPTMGTTGTVATYSCNAGYALTGTAIQTCQSAGTWSGTAPTCTLVTMGCTPDPCIHSTVGCMPADASGYTCGTCNMGWSGANCGVPVTCTGATAPSNGTVSASSATYGNTVTYGCDSGYTLMGNATATCQADGTFHGARRHVRAGGLRRSPGGGQRGRADGQRRRGRWQLHHVRRDRGVHVQHGLHQERRQPDLRRQRHMGDGADVHPVLMRNVHGRRLPRLGDVHDLASPHCGGRRYGERRRHAPEHSSVHGNR